MGFSGQNLAPDLLNGQTHLFIPLSPVDSDNYKRQAVLADLLVVDLTGERLKKTAGDVGLGGTPGKVHDSYTGIQQAVLADPLCPEHSNGKFMGLSLVVSVQVITSRGTSRASAIIDTAAQVTVLSDTFWIKLGSPELVTGEVTLRSAQRDSTMMGRILKNISLIMGRQTYTWNLLVAPISEDLILGVDFLKTHKCVVDLHRNVLTINGEIIPAYLVRDPTGKKYHVSQISTNGKIKFPPRSQNIIMVTS